MAPFRVVVVALLCYAIHAHVQVLVVGGTGNLATKYLWPAFEQVRESSPVVLQFWAGGVADITSGETTLKSVPSASRLGVRYALLRDGADYKTLAADPSWATDDITGVIVYLAVPPQFFDAICHHVHAHLRHPKRWIRIVVEKPFGHDIFSAEALATSLRGIFADDELFLIDHYMGKRGVHGLRSFLTLNQVEYAKWWPHLSHIQIAMHEAETVAQRTAFFDNVGIVRDVMANHLTLLWGLLNPPQDTLAHRRLDLVHRFAFESHLGVSLGQYDGYLQDVHNELNKPTTTTATAAAARFRHQERRDMTVSVAAGKALQHREVRVTLHFGTACVLEFVIQVGVSLKYDTKLRQGPKGESIQVCDALVESVVPPLGWVADNNTTSRQQLAPHKSMEVLGAYTFLLGKLVQGDATHFMHLDDILAAWRLWQPILELSDAAHERDLWIYPLGDGSFLDFHGQEQTNHDEF
ncbi:hypothetical protein, variant 1 [Aphanomyces astaci]|uniref:glucose-6-phosphate dehydrogenase (NADP(+)) n=1 Tax=Aphanomyces astaci TaxID=112090 RepID=W4H435_APHAT|nr:hypothetical protein, variant 1 [Aphanomyces astaci]ETV85918.1 hypothetical protein, variant 1 [Aphanomyces astaci]|eukprot:XP_009824393.1 hypothetical protein, variant 1 [Aphanomyces astaci]